MFVPLLDQVQEHCGEEHRVHRVPGDGAYDQNELFNVLKQRRILSGAGPRRMPRPALSCRVRQRSHQMG